jgi:hypothetical protein
MAQDLRGIPVSTGSAAALEWFEAALRQFQSYTGDPIATIDSALAEAPDFVAGHLFRGLAFFSMSERRCTDVRKSLADAMQLARG